MKGDILIMLTQCSPTAQWLYQRIEPIMWDGTPCGYLSYFEGELAKQFNTSSQTISHAMVNLRQHGILRKSMDGYWYAPHIIAAMVKRCLR